MSDNGSAYVAHAYRQALAELGLRHLRIRPYRPRTNGKAERFIQTLINEWAYERVYGSSAERATCLPLFLDRYNFRRPHGSLGHQPPASRLTNLPGTTARPPDARCVHGCDRVEGRRCTRCSCRSARPPGAQTRRLPAARAPRSLSHHRVGASDRDRGLRWPCRSGPVAAGPLGGGDAPSTEQRAPLGLESCTRRSSLHVATGRPRRGTQGAPPRARPRRGPPCTSGLRAIEARSAVPRGSCPHPRAVRRASASPAG